MFRNFQFSIFFTFFLFHFLIPKIRWYMVYKVFLKDLTLCRFVWFWILNAQKFQLDSINFISPGWCYGVGNETTTTYREVQPKSWITFLHVFSTISFNTILKNLLITKFSSSSKIKSNYELHKLKCKNNKHNPKIHANFTMTASCRWNLDLKFLYDFLNGFVQFCLENVSNCKSFKEFEICRSELSTNKTEKVLKNLEIFKNFVITANCRRILDLLFLYDLYPLFPSWSWQTSQLRNLYDSSNLSIKIRDQSTKVHGEEIKSSRERNLKFPWITRTTDEILDWISFLIRSTLWFISIWEKSCMERWWYSK